MEDIKVDFKLVIIVICIVILLGTLIWAGYNLYIEVTKDENEGIEYFEGDMSLTNIESIGTKESDLIDDDFFIQPNLEKKFQINNENPSQGLKNWALISVGSIQYSIPESSTKLKGENIEFIKIDMSYWTEDGTYEDFIEDFIDYLKSQDKIMTMDYKTRQLNIGGKEFKIVRREGEYWSSSYFCLARDGYAYCLEIIVEKRFYDNALEDTIDKIFSTFTII